MDKDLKEKLVVELDKELYEIVDITTDMLYDIRSCLECKNLTDTEKVNKIQQIINRE